MNIYLAHLATSSSRKVHCKSNHRFGLLSLIAQHDTILLRASVSTDLHILQYIAIKEKSSFSRHCLPAQKIEALYLAAKLNTPPFQYRLNKTPPASLQYKNTPILASAQPATAAEYFPTYQFRLE